MEVLGDIANIIPSANEASSSLTASKRSYLIVADNEVAQKMIMNAYNFFKQQNLNLGPAAEVTARCLGISKTTVLQYKNGPLDKPLKIKRKRPKLATADLSDPFKEEVRLVIYDMIDKHKHVTLDSLGEELAAKFIYEHKRSSLAILLKNLGFRYKKDDNRRALMEKPHVKALRTTFLKRYIQNTDSSNAKPFVFLDESWIFANGTVRRSWQDEDVRSVRKIKGEGSRWLVLHAGSSQGFIEGAELVFKCTKNSGDYHSEMNAETFENWLQKQLFPALGQPSIIVLDNASYHSRLEEKQPTCAWRKADLQLWLKRHNIQYEESDKKDSLLRHCKQHYKSPVYVVDKLIGEAGHEVLRLPPYHCIFNPIEMVWSQTKRCYDRIILNEKDPVKAWKLALADVTPQQWQNYIHHTEGIIKKFYDKERFVSVNDLIINVDLHSDESDSDFYLEDSLL